MPFARKWQPIEHLRRATPFLLVGSAMVRKIIPGSGRNAPPCILAQAKPGLLMLRGCLARPSPPRRRGRRFRYGSLSAEPELSCHRRAGDRVGRRRHRVIWLQIPARSVRGDIEAVLHPQVAAQGLRAKSALETHDILRLHRAPDRHRRRLRLRGRGRLVATETAQRAVHHRDQRPDLIDGNTVFGDITTDNFGDQIGSAFCVLPASAMFIPLVCYIRG